MKQRYDSYKPSGIDWIGEIPSHWKIMRMRYLCDIITGDKDTVNKVDDGLYPFYVRSPQIERINSYTFDGEAVLMAGDGVGAGKVVHYANGKFDFHQRVYNFHNFRGIKGILLYQYLKNLFKYKIEEGGAKNTVDSVRQPWLKDFPICIPPLSEQEAIAAWLDEKCDEIDTAIAKVDREIELIDELKLSEISRVVTRGLNPDVPLRPSGIDWIGHVPEHWSISPFKRSLSINNGCDYKHIVAEEGYPVIGSGGQFAYATDYLYDGEVVLLGRKGTIDKPMYFKGKFWTVDTMFYAIPYKGVCCRYMYYQALGFPFDYYSTATALPSMAASDLANNSIVVPPLTEQKEIADYLDKKCSEIDGLKDKLVKKRETLKELRQAIISEVVTGKRKVISSLQITIV